MMKRREFVVGALGAVGSLVPLVGRATEKPCPPSTLQVGGGTAVTSACAVPPAAGAPAWLKNRALYEWFEIPGTNLSSVEPQIDGIQRGNTGPQSKIITWQGAALKRAGSVYMLGAAGGHQDYAGNEFDAIALNTDFPKWVQLAPPSPSSQIINWAEVYLDYRRSATHTYYAQHFCEALDRMIMMPSSGMLAALPAPPADFPFTSLRPISFDFQTNDWMHPKTHPEYLGGGDFVACLAAQDHGTGDIYYARPYASSPRLWKFNPVSNTWANVSAFGANGYAGAAINHTSTPKYMLMVGSYGGTAGPQVLRLDSGATVPVKFGGLGAGALTFGGYPAVVYDEIGSRFIVIRNSDPISVFAVDATTWEVQALPTSGNPRARMNGLHNSVQYVPELRGLVVATTYSGNMQFMRLS